MKKPAAIVAHHQPPHASLSTYVVGFLLSLYLTLTAYWFTVHHALSTTNLVAAIIGLAILQFLVQVWFFLHIGRESSPRWNLLMFGFMLLTVCIVVFGSLWIMANLDYHHKGSPEEVNNSIIRDEGVEP
jgi:cytochrome o ubiquinol oxidase operon protein cyoD